jgi:hypothetical protein
MGLLSSSIPAYAVIATALFHSKNNQKIIDLPSYSGCAKIVPDLIDNMVCG